MRHWAASYACLQTGRIQNCGAIILRALPTGGRVGTKGLFPREETKVEKNSEYARFYDPARITDPNRVADTFATSFIIERMPGGCCIRFVVCLDHETGPDGIPIHSEIVAKIVMPISLYARARMFMVEWLDRHGLTGVAENPPVEVITVQ
jgi:hypothetical protein